MLTEQQAFELVKQKKIRMVCNKRAKKLRKKGRHVWWCVALNCFVWEMKQHG